jgi:hypothetical protein
MMAADEALALSMQHDVPWLPEVLRSPADFMVAAAFRPLEEEPLWAPFLSAVEHVQPPMAKVQLAGPGVMRTFGLAPARIGEHLEAKAVQMARALLEVGVTPLVLFDEPLAAPPSAELASLLARLRGEGARAGLHCCGQAPWGEVLALDCDVVSLDARLSLDALLEERAAWLAFLARGGTLCLGVIPTQQGARFAVEELCDSVEASLRATTPDFARQLGRMLISPACGLGTHSVDSARGVFRALTEAQRRLRAKV